jgi:hypothetical protein
MNRLASAAAESAKARLRIVKVSAGVFRRLSAFQSAHGARPRGKKPDMGTSKNRNGGERTHAFRRFKSQSGCSTGRGREN